MAQYLERKNYYQDKGLGRYDVRELGKVGIKVIRISIKKIFVFNEAVGEGR